MKRNGTRRQQVQVNLTDIKYVKQLKSDLEQAFLQERGERLTEYLEELVGYHRSVYDPQSTELTLINDGKRQVLATIKTVMRLSPTEVVAYYKRMEE